jgi:hypothetical protein
MWIDTQKWKQSFRVDELYETFEYKEKPAVDQLYPWGGVSLCVSFTCGVSFPLGEDDTSNQSKGGTLTGAWRRRASLGHSSLLPGVLP